MHKIIKGIFIQALALCLIQMFCYGQVNELNGLKSALPNISDSLSYVDALNRIAMLSYEKNADSTFWYAKRARQISYRLDYDQGKADALNNLGVFYDIKGNFQFAIRYYNEAYLAYTELKDTANRVQTLMNIAMVYSQLGKDERGIKQFKAALSLGEKLQKDSIMSLVIYNYLLLYPNQSDQALRQNYIIKARQIGLKYRDERLLVAFEQLVADDIFAMGKQEEGLQLLNKAIETAINKNLYYLTMDLLIDIGDKVLVSNSKEALPYYQRGLAIAERNGYLFYKKVFAEKLFYYYKLKGDSKNELLFSSQLLQLYLEQEKINNESGVDYLDYAIKDQQLKALKVQTGYQAALLVLALLVCLLAVFILISIRRNLKRTRSLNRLITSQNHSMKETLAALEQSQADNTRMMKMAAHDLRNPIGGIYSMATLMLEEADRSESDKTVLALIKEASENSLELVKELLHFQFKIEELKTEPVDVGDILKYCVSLLLRQAEAKGQKITLESSSLMIMANREKLWRVISNLIANAIKFSASHTTIEIALKHIENRVIITVKDRGIGIPEEIADKIFDMFTEAKRRGTAGEQSFGLGLAISKQIVEAHNGKIWFENNKDDGTTFSVELPIKRD